MSSSFNGLQPWLRPYAKALLEQFPGLTITSVFRSYSEQLALYRKRRTNPYPVAPPGRSYHGFGRAWDMVGDSATLRRAGAVWNSWGGTWSVRDEIHFQA